MGFRCVPKARTIIRVVLDDGTGFWFVTKHLFEDQFTRWPTGEHALSPATAKDLRIIPGDSLSAPAPTIRWNFVIFHTQPRASKGLFFTLKSSISRLNRRRKKLNRWILNFKLDAGSHYQIWGKRRMRTTERVSLSWSNFSIYTTTT